MSNVYSDAETRLVGTACQLTCAVMDANRGKANLFLFLG